MFVDFISLIRTKKVSGGGCKQESAVCDYFRYDADAGKSIFLYHVSVQKKPDEKRECSKSLKRKKATKSKTHLKCFYKETYYNVVEKEQLKT